MRGTLVQAALAAALALSAAGGASAQGTDRADPPTAQAPRPAADTVAPGKTATDAVTDPSAVPPAEGQVGSATPPPTGGAVNTPAVGAGPAR